MAPGSKSLVAAFKKVMGSGASMLRRGFNSSKCKTEAKMATARIKLLRNKREVQVRQMRRDIAMLIESGRDETARIRVEHVIREQNVMAANEIIELFCELVVARLPIIAKQRECPADLKEGIASLIYAAPRCSDIPELYRIRDIFEKKYGKDFVSAATDLRPDSGVNCMLIEKLSVRKPTGEVKLKTMKEIAKQYQIEWDTTESEHELLKPAEELLEGPRCFVSATSMPVKYASVQYVQSTEPKLREGSVMQFLDTASAAKAAAESAEKAISAAQAAAYLAQQRSQVSDQTTTSERPFYDLNNSNMTHESRRRSLNSARPFVATEPSVDKFKSSGRVFSSQSFNIPNHMNDEDMDTANSDDNKIPRKNTYNERQNLHSSIKFDDSDGLDSGRVFSSQSFNITNHMNDEDMGTASSDNNKILRRNTYHERKNLHSSIKFDDSDGLDSENDEIEMGGHSIEICPPPNRPPPVRPLARPPQIDHSKQNVHADNCFPKTNVHVHPKLPDYESLAARFEALKSPRS